MLDSSIVQRVLNLAMDLQQIPAPTFSEAKRAAHIQELFYKLGMTDSFTDETGNVLAMIKGLGNKPPLIISAHLDTVFPVNTELTLAHNQEKITGPGIGDNCLGLASLFGFYWAINAKEQKNHPVVLPADIWLVANVAEEGLGDLKGIKAVVDRFGGNVLAYLILEGMSLGQIYHRGLGVKRYRISAHTKGGHSWVDYGCPSAIHELAELIIQIKGLHIPLEPRTSFNIGVISGGTSVNTIASEASLQLDLRSVSSQVLDHLARQVESLVNQADLRGGADLRVEAEVIGNRPAGEIPADHPLVRLASDCYTANGIKVRLNIGSTDANVPLSRGFPTICIGITTGGGAHTIGEFIDVKPVSQGLDTLVSIVQSILQG